MKIKSNSKVFILTLVSLVFCVGFALAIYFLNDFKNGNVDDFTMFSFGSFIVISIVLLIVIPFIAKRAFSKLPLLEINEEYIYDRTSLAAFGIIYFKDIEKIEINTKFLSIFLKNPEEYYSKLGWYAKRSSKMNAKLNFGHALIAFSSFDRATTNEVVKYIHECYQKYQNNEVK